MKLKWKLTKEVGHKSHRQTCSSNNQRVAVKNQFPTFVWISAKRYVREPEAKYKITF